MNAQPRGDAPFLLAHITLPLAAYLVLPEVQHHVDRSTDWDRIVFLLSGDWSVPVLPALGLFLDERSQRKVHEATRALTRKIVGESGNYWDANFSDARKAAMKPDLIASLHKNGLADALIAEVIAFGEALAGKNTESGSNASVWIFNTLLQQLVATRNADELPPGVTKKTQEVVRDVIAKAGSLNEQVDIERALLESVTPWDSDLRKMTPGLPNYLTTWLVERGRFETLPLIWERLREKLSRDELAALLQWCVQEARGLMDPGTDLDVPRYMAS